ncbi:MAG: recombinase family protein [Bacteroidales bacterium]
MVGVYCRISKHKEEGRDVSIAVQKRNGIEFAKSIGLEFRVFDDEGVSGATDKIADRPEFALLLNAIKNKEITHVYCYDQSRIERNNRIWSMFVSLMLEHKCKYYPSGKFLDLDVPENKFFTGVMSLANELYATLTGIKVKEAIYLNAKKGKTHGLCAYGYKKGDNGLFEIIENEANIVKKIFQLSLDGIGTYTIAKMLNAEGIPTKFNQYTGFFRRKDRYTKQITTYKKENIVWRGNVVHDIITNPVYKGVRMWNGEPVPIPAILTEQIWQEVNDNLENNRKKVGKRDEYHYLLNGIIFCAECNCEFRGKKRLKGKDSAYKCKGKSKHYIICNSRGISIAKIETFIIYHLFLAKGLQGFLAGLPENTEKLDELKEKISKEKKELEYLQRAEEKAYKNLADPDFEDDEKIKEGLKTTKRKIKEKENAIDILENRLIEKSGQSRMERVENILGQYHFDAGFDETRKLVHSIIKRITIKHEPNKNSGNFLIKIEYRGFDESCIFMTNWQALNWYCLSYYRSRAISKEDLKEDKELARYLLKSAGKPITCLFFLLQNLCKDRKYVFRFS